MNQNTLYQKEKRWFILRVKVRHEKKVAKLLERQEFKIYNPTIKIKRKFSDRIKTIDYSAIPGIIFVQTSLLEKNQVFHSSSILGWFYENKIPVTVTENELKLLENSLSNRRWFGNYKDLILGDVLFLEHLGIDSIIKKIGMNHIWVMVKNSNLNLKLSRLIA